MKHSIVIITRNRPEEVRMVVHDLMAQTAIPEEIIIVDASDEKVDMSDLQENRESTVVEVLKSRPDICKQRNIGLQSACGEIITFFDDDVRLQNNYCEAVMRRFSEDSEGEITAIGGVMINPRVPGKIETAVRKLFMVQSYHGRNRVLPSGIPDFGHRFTRETTVEFLSSGALSIRTSCVKALTFEEHWLTGAPLGLETGRGFGEDVLLTLQLGLSGKLLVLPEATYEHFPSKHGRENMFVTQALYVYSLKYISSISVSMRRGNRVLRLWALFGQGLICLAQAIRFKDIGYINGYLLAMKTPCPDSPDLARVRRGNL